MMEKKLSYCHIKYVSRTSELFTFLHTGELLKTPEENFYDRFDVYQNKNKSPDILNVYQQAFNKNLLLLYNKLQKNTMQYFGKS